MSEHIDKISTAPAGFMDTLVDSERFVRFLERTRLQKDSGFLTLCIPFENIDPLAVLELNGDSNGTRFFWERPDHEMAVAAGNRVALIKNSGNNRFDKVSAQANSLLSKVDNFSEISHSMAGAHLVGGFSFFDQPLSGAWSPLGNASFFLPEWFLVRDGQFSMINITRLWSSVDTLDGIRDWYRQWISDFIQRLRSNLERSRILQDESRPGKSIVELESQYERKRWIANVQMAREGIRDKLYRKIVIARDLRLRTESRVSSTKLVHFLRKEYPSCYSFLYQHNGEATFLGSTPEKLLSLQSPYVKTEALAGSMPRGVTATQDAINEKKLLDSAKDREEHAYVLDSIREKLDGITDSLEHAPRPVIKKYANVQHLCTPVAASLSSEMNAVDIVARLHPTPAVGGYPESGALHHIQELEQFERGWYAGPIGWFNTNRRAEFSVAIRSGLIRRKHVQFFAGCGIVEDSDPGAEWEETRLKFLPMQKGLEYAVE
jgi:menaquinone-specific isochorismate synthase